MQGHLIEANETSCGHHTSTHVHPPCWLLFQALLIKINVVIWCGSFSHSSPHHPVVVWCPDKAKINEPPRVVVGWVVQSEVWAFCCIPAAGNDLGLIALLTVLFGRLGLGLCVFLGGRHCFVFPLTTTRCCIYIYCHVQVLPSFCTVFWWSSSRASMGLMRMGCELFLSEQRGSELSQTVLFPFSQAFHTYEYCPWITRKSCLLAIKIPIAPFQRAALSCLGSRCDHQILLLLSGVKLQSNRSMQLD